MGECDCINGCEKCTTPFNPNNVIRYKDHDGYEVVRADEYDKLLKLAQPSAEGDGWIAVTERLPEHDEPVLVWQGETYGIDWIDEFRHDGPEWVGDSDLLPTHWRPLPAPPVAKEGRES